MQTKKQLETVKAHFGQDWLRAQAGSTVQELLGIQSSSSVKAAVILGSSISSINSSARPLSSSTPLVSPGHTPPMAQLAAPYPGHLDMEVCISYASFHNENCGRINIRMVKTNFNLIYRPWKAQS